MGMGSSNNNNESGNSVPVRRRTLLILVIAVFMTGLIIRTSLEVFDQPFELILGRTQVKDVKYGDDGVRQDDYSDDDDNPDDVSSSSKVVPMRNGKPVAEAIANDKLAYVKERIGQGRGPIIVGGIGDSGTRGVWEVLMRLGVYMQGEENVRGDSKDSYAFMGSRPTTLSNGQRLIRRPSGLYNEPIKTAKSLKYNSSHVRSERWQAGRQFVADMINRVINDTLEHRKVHDDDGDGGLHPFGFKHPRTALLMPYFVASLGSKFAFIHVLRDGREVSAGDNNYLFVDHCRAYYGKPCDDWKAIEMWADLNRDVFEYALESPIISANQYFALRIEDLVSGNWNCYESLAKFLDVAPIHNGRNITDRIKRAMSGTVKHVSSYFGQHYTYNERQDMLVMKSKRARDALAFWGYADNKFALAKDCNSLPWVEAMRNRKGKLPFDPV